MSELKELLLTLSDQSLDLNEKFKCFVRLFDKARADIIDVIDSEEDYSKFIDIYYRFGKEISGKTKYDLLVAIEHIEDKLKRTKKEKDFIKALESLVKKLCDSYEAKNLIFRLLSGHSKNEDPNNYFYFSEFNPNDVIKIVSIYYKEKIKAEECEVFPDFAFSILRIMLRNRYRFIVNQDSIVKIVKL